MYNLLNRDYFFDYLINTNIYKCQISWISNSILQPLVSCLLSRLFLYHNHTCPSPASVETCHLLPDILLAVIRLHPAEVPAPVIAAHSKELLAQDADPDGVPAHREAGHQAPGVGAGVIALHAAEPALGGVTHRRGVMTAFNVMVKLVKPVIGHIIVLLTHPLRRGTH